jgi:hypothetical protein
MAEFSRQGCEAELQHPMEGCTLLNSQGCQDCAYLFAQSYFRVKPNTLQA